MAPTDPPTAAGRSRPRHDVAGPLCPVAARSPFLCPMLPDASRRPSRGAWRVVRSNTRHAPRSTLHDDYFFFFAAAAFLAALDVATTFSLPCRVFTLFVGRIEMRPPLGPGTAPCTRTRLFSASIRTRARFRDVTCVLPYWPAIRIPFF